MIEFSKYQGLGNDFILIDNRHQSNPVITPQQAVELCDRHFGIGADGVIFALPGEQGAQYTMRIFNSDGSEPEMCGNGIRCLAKFISDLEQKHDVGQFYSIHTLAGMITPQLQPEGDVKVDMGVPRYEAVAIPTNLVSPETKVINQPLVVGEQEWSVTCVSMGNPHCVVFVEDVDQIPLETIGPQFEHHPVFPQRINTEFIQVVNSNYLKMRVWERGAGITLACGTGACASVVAAVLTERSESICTVELPGGLLKIQWSAESGRVYMTGPAQKVFSGVINL